MQEGRGSGASQGSEGQQGGQQEAGEASIMGAEYDVAVDGVLARCLFQQDPSSGVESVQVLRLTLLADAPRHD